MCLEDVVVYGRLVVRGSGQVTMKGASWADQVVLSAAADSVHLKVEMGCVTKLKVLTPMATLSGFFTQVDLESDSVRLLLSSAWVENMRMLANHNVVMASPGSFVRYMESWGDQGAIMGTGQVEQVRAYGKALYVETPGTQVIALPGSDDVWAGVLLGGGSLVTPEKGKVPLAGRKSRRSWKNQRSRMTGILALREAGRRHHRMRRTSGLWIKFRWRVPIPVRPFPV